MNGRSTHLHAGGEALVGAAEVVDLGRHEVLQLVLDLVVGDDLSAEAALQDLAHHESAEGGVAGGLERVAEEVLEVLQLEGVLLAPLDPGLHLLQLQRQLLKELELVPEQFVFEVVVVVHEVSPDRLWHVHVLFEFLEKVLPILL
jgi:hypothetical protein